MAFAVRDTLTEEEVESGLRQVIKSGLASQAIVTLTGGAFLVAFALKLGASNLTVGLLAAIPPLAQLIQVPSFPPQAVSDKWFIFPLHFSNS